MKAGVIREALMPAICRKRIWWEPVPGVTTYVIHVWKSDHLTDPARFSWGKTSGMISRTVSGKTSLVIPDEWPEFPIQPATYHIAVVSKDEMGNQSDPFLMSGRFKFIAPPPPEKGGIESLPFIQEEPATQVAHAADPQSHTTIQKGLDEIRRDKELRNAYLGGEKGEFHEDDSFRR
jgi:hypothetical protein